MKKIILCLISVLFLLTFSVGVVSCAQDSQGNSNSTEEGEKTGGDSGSTEEGEESGGDPGSTGEETIDPDVVYPKPFETRAKNLDFIFDNETLGEMEITITREEWEKICADSDKSSGTEDCYHAKNFKFTREKNGTNATWNIEDVGLRTRGNTSRCSPQEGEDYIQAHFSVDFEEFLNDGDNEKKMAGCMKKVILKRCKDDPMYVREIYCYDYFRRCGVWTAPRAGYTHLTIKIIEADENVTTKDYGVYEMIEQIDKQYLKARTTDEGFSYNNNKGNLWKCLYPAAMESSDATDNNKFGVEEVTRKDGDYINNTYPFDLKTNKDKLDDARTEFQKFIKELNALDTSTESGQKSAKSWFESKMDVDLFINTYAINVILGMWDDYWINNNNYYFYFDREGKAYFIPYDYDNTLGTNGCGVDAANQDPFNWGSLENRPLIGKLLGVPEFSEKYKKALIKFSDENSDFDFTKSSERIKSWQNLIEDKINSPDLTYVDTSSSFEDVPAWWSSPNTYKLLDDDENTNYFKVRQNSIVYWNDPKIITVSLDPNGGILDGSDSVKVLELRDGSSLSSYQPQKDDNIFGGWKFCFYNEDFYFVYTVFEELNEKTLKANWIPETVVPYKFIENVDGKQSITFTYRPDDFKGKDSEIHKIVAVWEYTDWKNWESKGISKMNYNESEGIYTITYLDENFKKYWNGYKFLVYHDENEYEWVGTDQFKYILPDDLAQNYGDRNFLIKEWNW